MNEETIKSRLQAARALIDQPEKWTQGALARDAKDNPVEIGTTVEVVALCASGAIIEASMNNGRFCAEERAVRDHLMKSINGPSGSLYVLAEWNDDPGRTHAEVMQAFDRAIEEAQ